MERELKVKQDSIDTSGIKKDYKDAIIEYIWNGFDAKATKINISYTSNQLDGVESIIITDNGTGIIYDNLENTFDAFLSSEKKNNSNFIDVIHGSKGKGRFSFLGFANNCKWETIYEKDNEMYKFSIQISSEKKNKYQYNIPEKMLNAQTGTKVTIYNIDNLLVEQMESKELEQCILESFSWYLYLKKDKDYEIILNGKKLKYQDFINEDLTEDFKENINDEQFDIYFINWKDNVKYKYYFHMLDLDNNQKNMIHTKYNNNGIGFVHSVFITSNYFKTFEKIKKDEIEGQTSIENKVNEKDTTYKELIKRLNKIVNEKYKEFVRKESTNLIANLQKENIFPKFSEDIYGRHKRRELENTVKEVYCSQPRIFKGANVEQKKIIVHFLELLLNSDERENILCIMDNITNLSSEERENFSKILTKTKLNCIVDTIKMLDDRNVVIEKLKKLVFEISEYTNERDHIQKIMETNYWIFGEEYNLVTADKQFEKALSEYLYILDGVKEEYKMNQKEKNRRMDIFMAAKRPLSTYINSSIKEENIILELKAPKVIIGKEIFRQIEDYMTLIKSEPKFNSSLRQWKFYAISNKIDEFIKEKYKEYSNSGFPFLVKNVDNFQIFIMTWDDVFKNLEYKYNFLYDKLKIDKELVTTQIEDEYSREAADKLTEEINEKKVI